MGAQGTATLNFGAWPGSPEATVDVTGQTGYTASSLVEAWVVPVATADHSVEEHVFTNIKVSALFKANGTFTILGRSSDPPPGGRDMRSGYAQLRDEAQPDAMTERQLLYGQWTIGWVWN